MATSALEKWLDDHKEEIKITESGKVHSILTGHDIPKRLKDLEDHWVHALVSVLSIVSALVSVLVTVPMHRLSSRVAEYIAASQSKLLSIRTRLGLFHSMYFHH